MEDRTHTTGHWLEPGKEEEKKPEPKPEDVTINIQPHDCFVDWFVTFDVPPST